MDQHQLVSALKNLAMELGQTPTRQQFFQHVGKGSHAFTTYWVNWHDFVVAADLAPNRNVKITSSIFNKNIEKHIENYQPKQIPPKIPWPTIAILGDLHEPFGSDRVKAEFVSFVDKTKPQYVIQMGDLLDMYSHSKFPKSHNIFTAKEEEEAAITRVREFWSLVQKASPASKCIGLLGNHDLRPLKRTLEQLPQVEHWIEKYFKELMQFDGVEMVLDPRQEYIIADIAFLHGYLGRLGAHRDFMLMNTVRGHDHVGGVVFRQIHGRTLWELDAGLAGDYESKGLTYTPQKMTKQTQGFANIDSYGPRFIPL